MKLKITYFSLFFLLIAINSVYAHGVSGELFLLIIAVIYLPAICLLTGLTIAAYKMKEFSRFFKVAAIVCLLGGFYISNSGNFLPIFTLVFHQDGDDLLRIFLFYILQVFLFSCLWGMIHKE